MATKPPLTPEQHRARALDLAAEARYIPGPNSDRPIRLLLEGILHATLAVTTQAPTGTPAPASKPTAKKPSAKVVA